MSEDKKGGNNRNNNGNNSGNGSDFSIDKILAEVRAARDGRIDDEDFGEEAVLSRSMEDIDKLLEPRKRIEVSDIITDELLEAAGEKPAKDEADKKQESPKPPVKEEKTRIVGGLKESDYSGNSFRNSKTIVGAGGKIETDEYRRRFINRPVQKIERTADFQRKFDSRKPEMIERPGIVTRRSSMSATADLAPLPTLVTAEDADNNEKTRKSGFIRPRVEEKTPEHREIEGQIRFDAFENASDDWVEKIDEEEAEEALKKKRKEKIKGFKIFGIEDLADIEDDEDIEEIEESEDDREESSGGKKKNTKKSEKQEKVQKTIKRDAEEEKDTQDEIELYKASDTPKVAAILRKEMLHSLGGIAVCVFFTVMYLIFTLTGYSSGSAGAQMLTTFNLVVVCAAVIGGGVSAIRGAENFIKGKPNANTAVTAALLAAAIQGVWAFGVSPQKLVPLYGCAAALCTVFNLAGHYLVASRAYKNLRFLAPLRKKYSIQEIENKETAFEIGRGLLMGDPDIRCSVPTKFPSKFIENTYAADPANKYSKVMMPVFFLLSLAAGIIYAVIKSDYFAGASLFAAAACVSMPSCALIASNLPLGKADTKLTHMGAMISGHKAVGECGDVNAVVLDSSDIFSEGGCTIYGIKTYHGMRVDDAILDTAAIVIKAGGPSGEVFDRVILGKRDILPPVENLVYEDKLGLSAWIHGRRVLVGNRDLLINHNVEAPNRESELKYRHDNRQIMYLAVSGKIAAMFVVGYKANPGIKASLKMMENKGISVLVRTSDANITEELISNFFGVHKNAVKVISAVAGEMYRKERLKKRNAEAKIIHNGSVKSMLGAVNAAAGLYYSRGLITSVQSILSAFGFGIAVLLVFLSGFKQLPAYSLVIYQLICAGIIYCFTALKKKL